MATSKPPSGSRRASSKRQLPELFFDRSLGRVKVPARLRQFHPVVIAHDDLFAQDTDDEIWLAEAGRRRRVVLMAEAFVTALPTILSIVRESPGGGYVKGVNRRGQVRPLFP